MKVAVIGTGYWGRNHVRVWSELREDGLVDDVILYDINTKAIEKFTRDFGMKPASSLDAILDDDDIVAIDVVTPTPSHFDLGKRAMEAGKDVFIEKPITASSDEAKELIAIAEINDRMLMPGHIFRYHPALKEVKRRINRGDIGKVLTLRTERVSFRVPRTDVGVLFSLAIHDVDIYSFLMNEVSPSTIYANSQDSIYPGIDDTSMVVMKYDNGANGYIYQSWLSPTREKVRILEVIGERMSLWVDYLQPHQLKVYDASVDETMSDDGTSTGFQVRNDGMRTDLLTPGEPLKEELTAFLNAIETRETPVSNMNIGLRAVKMVETCIESAKQDRPLKFEV